MKAQLNRHPVFTKTDINFMSQLNISVLDLAPIRQGDTPQNAICQARGLAQKAEKMGYTRFWMAEHHNMANIASSATAVLLGHIAEATSTIRLGSGGVMLPNHSPLIIAEQFGTLATMYPGRIDLGLGRAPGTDEATAREIRTDRIRHVQNFPQNVQKLQQFLSGANAKNSVRAIPGEGTEVPLWILGSSTDSAHLAATLGLPYVFASHFAPQQLLPALQIYRDEFEASGQCSKPYVIVCVNVVAADTDERASYLSTSLKRMMMGVVTGEREPLQPPVKDMNAVWNSRQQEAVMQMLSHSLIGGKETVRKNLIVLRDHTQADEIMVSCNIFDQAERFHSLQIFADICQGMLVTVSS